MIRDTSKDAYVRLELQPLERRIMLFFHDTGRAWTRKEVSAHTGLAINNVCGRINSLVKKGYLQELETRRDGGYLLQVMPRQMELIAA